MTTNDESSPVQSSTDIFGWGKFSEELGEFGEEHRLSLEEGSHTFYLDRHESPSESEMMLEAVGDLKGRLMEQIKTLLYNLITDRPDNVIDYFEEYVRNVITGRPAIVLPIPKDTYFDYETLVRLNSVIENLKANQGEEDIVEEEQQGEEAVLKREYNFLDRMNNFADSGVALSKAELIGVLVAINFITDQYSVSQVRFWGKIFGLYKNYYILEAEVTEEIFSEAMAEEKQKSDLKELRKKMDMGEEEEVEPKIRWEQVRKLIDYRKPPEPVSTYKPPILLRKELRGRGVNTKIFYASNEASRGYTQLPDVLPIELVRAREIKRFFTGNLDSEVNTIPPFPGKEINLLRAQIARISAGTNLSPLGFYTFETDEGGFEEEEEDEDVGEERKFKLPRKEYTLNPDFEPIPLQDLVDPSMSFWAHHIEHILPQGRTKWIDPTIDPDALPPEDLDVAGEGEAEKGPKAVPEVGPALLTPASEDMILESAPAWCTRLTMDLSPKHGGAVTRSNLWLGAYTYSLANDVVYDNVYIGWGHKYNSFSYTPKPYFTPQNEYEIGPEVLEITDPNPEEEDYEGILYEKQLAEEKLKKKLAKQ